MLRIALCAGHGPETPGKRSPDPTGLQREFHFNEPVTKLVGEMLLQYKDVEVLFVHESDREVSLRERTDKANAWDANVYISIHANAFGTGVWNSVQGIETFVYTSRPPAAVSLANAVHRELIKATGRPDRGVKSANFHVLREVNEETASILVECGFMTNHEEAQLLQSDEYRLKCAKAIVEGVVVNYELVQQIEEVHTVSHFTDVTANHWAAASIKKAAESGIMIGVSQDEFGVGQAIKREELAVILDRLGLLERQKI